MIRKWRRSKDSYAPLVLRVSILISETGLGGKRLKMVVSLSKPVLIGWKVEDNSWCLLRCYGTLLFPQT